jgi:thioredoxin:protein disulfide reductase
MKAPMNALLFVARTLALALSLTLPAAAKEEFLAPSDAFQASLRQAGPDGLPSLHFKIAPRYHLYRDRFALSDGQGRALSPALPAGRDKFDPGLGQTMAMWEGEVLIALQAPAAAADWQVRYQGCADDGLCYPPQSATLQWRDEQGRMAGRLVPVADTDLFGAPAAGPSAAASAPAAVGPAAAPDRAAEESDRIARALGSGSLPTVLGVFAALGLLLSFTPCVLPMLPILSSIIVGQAQPVSRARGLGLALAYSLGMAVVYTAMGMLAGWLGQGLAGALQNPWVLGAFALLLALLALSMFGAWQFQMPPVLQQRLSTLSNRIRGGRSLGVFAMGMLSALLLGPCVAAPLAGVLVYISQTRDLALGGAALFSLACGMSVPLLLLGLSAGSLLPRAGAWMERVKALFGVLLLATALWLVSPVLPAAAVMLALGTGVLVGACLLGWPAGARTPPHALVRAVAVPLGLWGAALWVGALSGGDSIAQPLGHLARRADAGSLAAGDPAAPRFQRVTSDGELQQALAAAAGRPIMLDYYADWCVACKEMEHLTFSDPQVRDRMRQALLIQADVTRDSADSRALLKRFQLFGPPAIVFLDAQGRETDPGQRVVGFMPASDFRQRLERVIPK